MSSAGTSVGTIASTDIDVEDSLTFTIATKDHNVPLHFSISNVNGAQNRVGMIKLSDESNIYTLDFEATSTYSLTVTVTDESNANAQADTVIYVTDENDFPVLRVVLI